MSEIFFEILYNNSQNIFSTFPIKYAFKNKYNLKILLNTLVLIA